MVIYLFLHCSLLMTRLEVLQRQQHCMGLLRVFRIGVLLIELLGLILMPFMSPKKKGLYQNNKKKLENGSDRQRGQLYGFLTYTAIFIIFWEI